MIDPSTYPPADLLDTVADSREEAAEVRRILHGITEADLDAQERFKRAPFPIGAANHAHRHSRACSRCESGLTHCTTPEACECAEPSRPAPSAGDLVRVAALFLGAWAAVVFVLVVTGLRT